MCFIRATYMRISPLPFTSPTPWCSPMVIRHSKYLNNVVEQDHRAVRRLVRPMLEFKSFWAARCTLGGIEVMHAIRKGQLAPSGTVSHTPAEQCYALAA
jgi:putative transposase